MERGEIKIVILKCFKISKILQEKKKKNLAKIRSAEKSEAQVNLYFIKNETHQK